jgi:hypothetical protein
MDELQLRSFLKHGRRKYHHCHNGSLAMATAMGIPTGTVVRMATMHTAMIPERMTAPTLVRERASCTRARPLLTELTTSPGEREAKRNQRIKQRFDASTSDPQLEEFARDVA